MGAPNTTARELVRRPPRAGSARSKPPACTPVCSSTAFSPTPRHSPVPPPASCAKSSRQWIRLPSPPAAAFSGWPPLLLPPAHCPTPRATAAPIRPSNPAPRSRLARSRRSAEYFASTPQSPPNHPPRMAWSVPHTLRSSPCSISCAGGAVGSSHFPLIPILHPCHFPALLHQTP